MLNVIFMIFEILEIFAYVENCTYIEILLIFYDLCIAFVKRAPHLTPYASRLGSRRP